MKRMGVALLRTLRRSPGVREATHSCCAVLGIVYSPRLCVWRHRGLPCTRVEEEQAGCAVATPELQCFAWISCMLMIGLAAWFSADGMRASAGRPGPGRCHAQILAVREVCAPVSAPPDGMKDAAFSAPLLFQMVVYVMVCGDVCNDSRSSSLHLGLYRFVSVCCCDCFTLSCRRGLDVACLDGSYHPLVIKSVASILCRLNAQLLTT